MLNIFAKGLPSKLKGDAKGSWAYISEENVLYIPVTYININLYLYMCTTRVIETVAKADSLKIILGLHQYGNTFALSNEVHDKTSIFH